MNFCISEKAGRQGEAHFPIAHSQPEQVSALVAQQQEHLPGLFLPAEPRASHQVGQESPGWVHSPRLVAD